MSSHRILVVEDNPITRKMLRVVLETEGYEVFEAADARSALGAADAHRMDLIVADYVLPDMDGISVITEIRRLKAEPELPALVVTAMVSRVEGLRAVAGPLTKVVGKPIAPSLLLNLARAQLAGGNARGSAGEVSKARSETLNAAGRPSPWASPELPTAEHTEHLQAQLERETARNEILAREVAIQASALSVMRDISEALTQPEDVSRVIGDVLVHCLNATGLSTGLLYLMEPGGRTRLQAQFGIPVESRADAEAGFGHGDMLRRIVESGQPLAGSSRAEHTDVEIPEFLLRLGHASVLFVPFVALGQGFGVLVLASDTDDLSESAWLDFASTLAAQFGQTVALGQSLTRLRASENRYHALMEQANDAILILDLSRQILEANGEAMRLLGRRGEEIVGRYYDELLVEEEREDCRLRWTRLQTKATLGVENCHFLRSDGRRVPAEVSASLVRVGEESGGPTVLAILRDTTKREQAEEALRTSEARMRSVVDSALDAVVAMDAQGRVVSWNPAAETMFGWAQHEALGRTVSELIIPTRYREAHASGLDRFLLTGTGPVIGRRIELSALHRDGSEFPIELAVTSLNDGGSHLFTAFVEDITARKEAERALLESQERNRLVLDSAAEAIYGLDLAGNCTFANPACAKLLGFETPDALLGRNMHALVHHHRPDGRAYPTEECPIYRAFRTGALVHVTDEVLWRHDGSSLPVEYWSHPMLDDGEVVGAVVTFLDVTKRRAAEAALQEAQERLEHVVSSSPAVLYSLRPEGDLFVANWMSRNVERLLGFTADEVLSPEWWPSHLHPEDRERVIAELPALLTDGSVAQEYRFLDKRGRYLWLRAELRMLRDAADTPVEVVGSWADITGRKTAELKLQESEEQYRQLFDSNPQSTWVYDIETLGFLAVNDATVRHYGYSRHEFLSMTVLDIRAPGHVRLFEEHLASGNGERPQKPRAAVQLWQHHRKDGSLIDVETADSPIEFRGRPARLVLATDVTDKKRLEAQLLQSQKMESVGRLAGGVAHDFNNLLGVIMGYGELLGQSVPHDSRTQTYVEEIVKAAERAAGLTRQLLAFSRTQVLQPRIVDLNTIVGEMDKMLRRLIGEDIQLVTVIDEQLGPVMADPGQIEQVIMNLAVNARDALPRGGQLTIETANVELDAGYTLAHEDVSQGSYVMLAVSDTGHGMSAEVLPHIFEPFFTTKEAGKGTGLGLATVHGIVKQSGGHIFVYSEPEHGTAFKIYLPRTLETAAVADAATQSAVVPGSETILLVEDEASLRSFVRECLEASGYAVLEPLNAIEACDVADRHAGAIHLLVTDVVMPGMSGRDVAERAATSRPEMKVLYMSGYTDDAILRHGILDDGAAFLQKPFTGRALGQKVREVLDQK